MIDLTVTLLVWLILVMGLTMPSVRASARTGNHAHSSRKD